MVNSSQHPIFKNIINKEYFEKLSTAEKIKHCLEKNLFFLTNKDPLNPQNIPEDISSLNFDIFNNEQFSLNEIYEVDDYVALLTGGVYEEIFNEICKNVDYSYTVQKLYESVKFDLATLMDKSSRQTYLSDKLKEINPLNLQYMKADFNWESNEFVINPDLPTNLVSAKDWIYLDTSHTYTNFREYKEIDDFCKDYQKFVLASICYNELQQINNSDEIDEEENPTKFTAYQQAYFLYKIGIVKKMVDSGFTDVKIAKVISKLIGKDYENTRKNLREFNTAKFENIGDKKQKAIKEIEKLINSIDNLG